MGDLMHELNERLAGEGAIELTNDERALIVESLRALVVAEQRVALQDRLLESFGQDREALMRLMSIEGEVRFGGGILIRRRTSGRGIRSENGWRVRKAARNGSARCWTLCAW